MYSCYNVVFLALEHLFVVVCLEVSNISCLNILMLNFKNTSQKLRSHNGLNWIGGVMFNVLASSTVDRGFEHR